MATHFDVLGVSAEASPETIRAAYRGLAKRYHPDAPTGDAERFKRIGHAYEALSRRQAPGLLVRPAPATSRALPNLLSAGEWLRAALGALAAVAGAWCWWLGDGGGRSNGWAVAVGWVLVIMGWRIFAERKQAFRNPLASLAQGLGIVAAGAAGMAFSVLAMAIGLILIAGAIGLVGRILG